MLLYEELLELISWGIPRQLDKEKERIQKHKKIQNAFYGGHYVGAPGRDIKVLLPFLNYIQLQEIANELSNQYPLISKGNHIGYSACIRYIYGMEDSRLGLLQSKEYCKTKKEKGLDWEVADKLIKLLENNFIKKNNHYGLCILYEMKAHRLGDKFIISGNKKFAKKMEQLYVNSQKKSQLCNSYKHKFSPYFWAAKYFEQFKMEKKMLYYANLCITAANETPAAKESYANKIMSCFLMFKKTLDKKQWYNFYKQWKRKAKNRAIKLGISKALHKRST